MRQMRRSATGSDSPPSSLSVQWSVSSRLAASRQPLPSDQPVAPVQPTCSQHVVAASQNSQSKFLELIDSRDSRFELATSEMFVNVLYHTITIEARRCQKDYTRRDFTSHLLISSSSLYNFLATNKKSTKMTETFPQRKYRNTVPSDIIIRHRCTSV